MAIGTDFEIQDDRDIRYIGAAHEAAGAGYYPVLDFHEWLRGLADDASSSSDDYMDITRATPSEKAYDTIITLQNNYNIDQTASEHLYGGSIIQANGDEIWDGIQIVANEGCHVEIVQDGALIANDFWNSTPDGESLEGLNRDVANGISARFMVKVRNAGADIDGRRLICQTREWFKTYSEFKVNGTGRGINVVPLTYADDLNNTTAEATVATWTTIAESPGYINLDVDNDSTDEYYYAEWDRAGYTINQFYERMKWLSRRGTSSDIHGLGGELFRGITHEITIDNISVQDWDEPYEEVTWTGGTGWLLAIDDPDAPTTMWIQLLDGVAPTDGQTITGTTSTATADVNVDVEEKTLSFPFCGTSTGTALIGAYGFSLEVLDLSEADKMTALDGLVYQAPNYVTFEVSNLVTSDYIIVGPRGYRFAYDNEATGPFTVGELLTFGTPAGTAYLADLYDLGDYGVMYIGPMQSGVAPQDDSTISGATATADVNGAVANDIHLAQLTLNGALTGGTVTSVVVNEVIPGDTPSPTGTIRIKRASGKYTRHPYSAWNSGTKTFTITSHDFSTDNAPDDGQVFISYIDTAPADDDEEFTSIYSSDRSLFIRVRNGGASTAIKTFETTGVLSSAGGSSSAVRTSDL